MSARVIWKFTLNPFDPQVVMPAGARVLHVREQSEQVRIWAEVDPSAPRAARRFAIGLTGQAAPPGAYVGTAIVNETASGLEVVVHVYDLGEEAPFPAAVSAASPQLRKAAPPSCATDHPKCSAEAATTGQSPQQLPLESCWGNCPSGDGGNRTHEGCLPK